MLAHPHAADARALRLARLRHSVAGGNSPGQLEIAREKQRRMAAYQVSSEMQTPTQLMQREPLLRAGLQVGCGCPATVSSMPLKSRAGFIADAGDNLTCLSEGATEIAEPAVTLTSGKRRRAPAIVVAAASAPMGCWGKLAAAKKGQLAITDRYGPLLHHQLVELGYGASAHGGGTSVAFNVQPRPTGQLLIGSSRQFDHSERQLDLPLLAQMLDRARHFLPPSPG